MTEREFALELRQRGFYYDAIDFYVNDHLGGMHVDMRGLRNRWHRRSYQEVLAHIDIAIGKLSVVDRLAMVLAEETAPSGRTTSEDTADG